MSPEQATTLLDWWQEQSFDGKSLFALSAEGSLTLKEIQDILLKKKLSFNELKAAEVKKILLEELSDNNNSEGITLKNIRNIHIVTPSWNFSEIDQAIARGYRLFSHND
mgnify:CR=1 FL=1